MRVLQVVHFPVFGGPHNQALRLDAALAARGFDTVVVVPDEPGNAVERLRRGGVDVRTMRLHRLRATLDPREHLALAAGFVSEIAGLRRIIRDEHIDIVQVGGLVNPHAAIAARLGHVPIVWQLLDTRAPRPLALAAMAWVRLLADVVMSTGTKVAMAHPGYAGIADRVVPFTPPVDLERFSPRRDLRDAVRATWGVASDALVVGCVANLNPQKGIIDLARAFALVRSRLDAVHLVLIGADYRTHAAYASELRAQLRQDRLEEGRDVIFVGERDDVERQLAGMDVVALAATPRSEGITTAVLEAMAVGVPVVVTDVGSLREVVDDGRSGFVVPAGDRWSMAEALTRLLADAALRERMGAEAHRDAVARFGATACAERHVHAYHQALAIRGRFARGHAHAPERHATEPLPPDRVIDGIAVFVGDPGLTAHDEIGQEQGHAHKEAQALHFDLSTEEDFEIDRPHGTPRLYRFLLTEKFRRASGPIRRQLMGASALVVCGGSGMDAEFLARAGADVTTSDLSLGAAKRASRRSERYGLETRSIVADVEHLPYAGQSVDLVAVHDGLHHLDDPLVGLAEMARVAGRWVVVTEPARASITKLAIRLGLALEAEQAGNRVARMEPAEVATFLEARGYAVLRAGRYAMYYPHHPGAVFTCLSGPIVFPIICLGWRVGNALLGRFGNKMVVVAERKRT